MRSQWGPCNKMRNSLISPLFHQLEVSSKNKISSYPGVKPFQMGFHSVMCYICINLGALDLKMFDNHCFEVLTGLPDDLNRPSLYTYYSILYTPRFIIISLEGRSFISKKHSVKETRKHRRRCDPTNCVNIRQESILGNILQTLTTYEEFCTYTHERRRMDC